MTHVYVCIFTNLDDGNYDSTEVYGELLSLKESLYCLWNDGFFQDSDESWDQLWDTVNEALILFGKSECYLKDFDLQIELQEIR